MTPEGGRRGKWGKAGARTAGPARRRVKGKHDPGKSGSGV
ncbi:hypothetical protein B4135_4044 [Caldibacillus debilis]|uniref:Uncharacterized protein n=1 Tax=Caldibacillus debilis TaxID=301148 RepID=A0A150L7P2_9BACI|nr:hypothetical protein B4135_4044 [Caldibacillus debilis]